MSFDRSNFFGHWDLHSGPIAVELLLHDDGTYGASIWGGLQQHWGVWRLEEILDQTVLVLDAQGGYPPGFLALFGSAPISQRHTVEDVSPNQITLYDATMSRRFVAPAQLQPALPPTPSSPPPFPSLLNAYLQMPIMAPSPLFSAPAPPQPPPSEATAIMDAWKNAGADKDKIRDILIQTYTDDRENQIAIQNAVAAEDLSESKATSANIQAQADAMHDQAQQFIASLKKGGKS
jgi:hypothetical protein